ncbi:PREDICTED: tRNA pseudouridine(38/39) synthase-like [Branchiostoma belcheri]|uniref:tRNA pseudouridine(38/39) synthase-like n=1 Tax=Branchiostoma belcheri TaxID=7741 RepID=A0A6P4Z1Q0_BRABE|nr:PREDICTED: tRNA pseudouridine(38/39) synthase-like [Branchiostoma belcheri]
MALSETRKPEELTREELIVKVNQLQEIVSRLESTNNATTEQSVTQKKQRKQKPQRKFDFTKYNTRHVALKIAYLGWSYDGFQSQDTTDNTIEARLFEALTKTRLIEKRQTSNYHRCGRTDKGVSAFGQVISLDLRTNLTEGAGVIPRPEGTANHREGDNTTEIKYVYILNKVLPPDIRVLAWAPVDPDFSARFSCQQRTYKYFFPKGNLDIQRMHLAAQKLVGEHDFRNFCKMDVANGVVTFIRRIMSTRVHVTGEETGGYQMCEFQVVGNAFLWHQVRCMVAVLFLIGQGQEEPSIVDDLLDIDRNPRKPQYHMASELPLVLYDSTFDGVSWIYDHDTHEQTLHHLQKVWCGHVIKTNIVKSMLDSLEKVEVQKDGEEGGEVEGEMEDEGSRSCVEILKQNESLIEGTRTKVYRPLLERPMCESLEDRIEHYSKKRKLDNDESS